MDPQPQTVLDFWTDLIDNSRNYLKYYLSNDVTLDWFGQTVKGQSNVANFIKLHVNPLKHHLIGCQAANKIGFRDTHKVIGGEISRPTTRRMTLLSPPRVSLMQTPKKSNPEASTSGSRKRLMISQPKFEEKRPKLDANENLNNVLEAESEAGVNQKVKYLTSNGEIEFHRKSLKKLQQETKWRRQCKLHLAYDVTNCDVKDSTFFLIIYEGTVKCRRNLLKDFEQED